MTQTAIESLTAADVRLTRQTIEHYFETGYSDGLPVVPPIQEFVDEFLAQTPRDPNEVITSQYNVHRTCTIQQAAVCAVMAGCKPEYFPIILATLDALQSTDGWQSAALQSTTGSAQMLVINGPVRQRFGFNSQQAVFGPGFRPNATIPRAIRLLTLNVFGIKPGEFDQATQATPARYGLCIAENEEDSPWEPLHVERGLSAETDAVSIVGLRSLLHVEQRHSQDPETILATIADSMAYAGGLDPGHRLEDEHRRPGNSRSSAIIGPEHANILAAKGWSKSDTKQGLWKRYGRTAGELRRAGKGHGIEDDPDERFIHFAKGPESISVIVAGAYNCGISAVATGSANLTREIIWP